MASTPPPIKVGGIPEASDIDYNTVKRFEEPTRLDFQVIRTEIQRLENDLEVAPMKIFVRKALAKARGTLQELLIIKRAYYRVSLSDPPSRSTSCCSYGC